MTDVLTETRRMRDEFQTLAYLLVHDLKEPTRTIRTGAELLLESQGPDGGNREVSAVSSSVERILRGASRLDDIAGSIAQYADDLGGEDEPNEATNVEGTLRAVRQKLGRLIQATGAVVSNDPLPTVDCQPSALARLLEALVKNAICYRGEQPPIIHVSAQQSGANWLFSISDNGMGIADSDLERIFDPRSRLKTTSYKGLGMGLTTCRRIVIRHGGRIWIESTLGLGSKVFFIIPV